ncbi:MAG: metal-dependent transcriptional regulator [Synergistaceae bacterium]|jgi:DtxR family Mn-dependent transcriptional regulator|nr:metal-dependent transcriptional regulator [Synergistaceae bacterium]
MDLTARVEDYLEAVLEIEMTGEIATVTQLAKNLGVTKATVTAALKRLKLDGLLEHERYGDVILTEEGRQKALAVYRRHEFLTDFFVRILGFSRERAQKVSCVMEHEIDEHTERRLAAFTDALAQAERKGEEWLKRLQEALDTPKALPLPLCMMPSGSSGAIARLTAQYELRRRLNAAGFVTDVHISNIQKQDGVRGGLFTFSMNDIQLRVGITEASAIWLYQPDTA